MHSYVSKSLLRKTGAWLPTCKSTLNHGTAPHYSSSPNRPSSVGSAFGWATCLPTPGSHLCQSTFTDDDPVELREADFPQLTNAAHVVQVGGHILTPDAELLYFGHPDSVEHLHRFDAVPHQIELAEVVEFYLRTKLEDLLFEDISWINYSLLKERVLTPHRLMWDNIWSNFNSSQSDRPT